MEELYYQQEAVKAATEATAKAVEVQNTEAAKPPAEQQPMMITPSPLPVTVVDGGSGGSSGGDDFEPDTSGDQLGGLVSGFQWGGALRAMRAADLLPMPRFADGWHDADYG